MTAIIFDTETTGAKDPVIIQAAWASVEIVRDERARPTLNCIAGGGQKFNPGKPIEFGAMAVHHITDEDVAHCAPASEFKLDAGVEYLIGHKVDFDWEAAGKPEVKRICTLALAQMLWPELDSHKLLAIVYRFDRALAKQLAASAHDAETDVILCRHVLQWILDSSACSSFDQLWQLSERARVPTIMPFGKHKGEPIKNVPADYRKWLLGQPDVDPYLRIALEQ